MDKDIGAPTSLVCREAVDKAEESDVGVNDHSIKFPYPEESEVRTCSSICWWPI